MAVSERRSLSLPCGEEADPAGGGAGVGLAAPAREGKVSCLNPRRREKKRGRIVASSSGPAH